MKLEKYSMGIGDRFGRQGRAQLSAMAQAREAGIDVTPVWNKSHREHSIIGTEPGDVRREADAAVEALGWGHPYRVDADHIGLANVDLFLDASDFFTLDVADYTGQAADEDSIRTFVDRHADLVGDLDVPGLPGPVRVTRGDVASIARRFLLAVTEAGRLYRHIEQQKGAGALIAEVSMDETDSPQSPVDMLFILAAIADEGIPAQTIAPRFSGRFNKGVDYVGDVAQFEREFKADLAVLAYAVERFDLPDNLKLSVHSGSDKFSIYGPICDALRDTGAGLHLKTAGTTWLEEIIGLAAGGGDGLALAKSIYAQALAHSDELCAPYASVIDIRTGYLPAAGVVANWSSDEFVAALRHDPACPDYNPDLRQLLHVGYKIAAQLGDTYLAALDAFEDAIAPHVTENILDRHLKRVFPSPRLRP